MGLDQDLLNIMSIATISIAVGVFLGLTAWSLLFAVIRFVQRLVFGGFISQGFNETKKILGGATGSAIGANSEQKKIPHWRDIK